jgi:hypothetical protein
MLRVKLLRKACPGGEAVLVGFRVEGHADFGEYGTDIVCAGVSAMAQAAVFGLREALGDALKTQKKGAYLEVSMGSGEARKEGPRAILRTFELGARSVERSYPGTVEVRDEVFTSGE